MSVVIKKGFKKESSEEIDKLLESLAKAIDLKDGLQTSILLHKLKTKHNLILEVDKK